MRIAVVATAVCLSLVGLSVAGNAKASIRKDTNIPAEGVGPALQTLAKAYHFQVLYRTEVVGDLRTAGAVGAFTASEALTKVLSGTGLSFKYLDENTVTIISAAAVSARSPGQDAGTSTTAQESDARQKEGKSDSSTAFLLAQAAAGQDTSVPWVEKRAAESSQQSQVLEEVIVTAQKRMERLIDVPISIVAVSADELQKRRVTTLEDLPSAVPGLAISSSGPARYIELRGISNISGATSLIGLYLDEADVTLAGSAQVQLNPSTYDLERVEVLRGPQGTLYGEGSAGGTIRFITNKPDLNHFVFGSDVAALFTQNGAPSQRINAVVNVPLIEAQLGLRIVGTYDHEGGWIDQPAADLKDINGQDLTNVRIKGLWQPSSQFTVSAMAVINRNDRSFDFSDQNAPGGWTQVFNLTTTPRLKNDYDLYNLTLTYDFASARLLSTTSYVSAAAPNWNQGLSYQLTPPGTPRYDFYEPSQRIDDHLLTQELRLASGGSGPWRWTLGGFYRHFRDTNDQPLYYFDLAGPPGTPLSNYFSYAYSTASLSESWSAFGDASYKLLDRLTLGAGVRYFQDDQEFTDLVAVTTQSARFHSVDPRFYAQYKLTDGLNIYASAAKGFRSGGFNAVVSQPTFGPEAVWTYEFGTKMSLLQNRLSLDAAVFYSNYSDYQIFGTSGLGTTIFSNAGSARLKGVEWDLSWQPLDKWTVSVHGDYLDTRFTQIDLTSTAYNVGDPLDLVPKYQFAVSGERDFSWEGKSGFVRIDYSQQGRESYRNRNVAGPSPWYFNESDVIHLLNFHTSLHWSDNLSLGFFAQNLLNDQGFVNPFSNIASGVRSRPRTFGIEFGVMFK